MRLRRLWGNPAVASALLALAVFALIAAVRERGLLQSAEFLAYDKFLIWRAGPEKPDEKIVLVEISEKDIGKYDFPIPDERLATLLEAIEAGGPLAIGLDLYRDLAVPRKGNEL